MSRTHVVVELDSDHAAIREGRVVADLGGRKRTVRWADGSEQDLQIGAPFLETIEGSLLHRSLVDHEAFVAILKDDPAELFLMTIRDAGRSLTASEILKRLASAGLDSKAVAIAWKKSRALVEGNGSVMSNSAAPPRYRWYEQNNSIETVGVPAIVAQPVSASTLSAKRSDKKIPKSTSGSAPPTKSVVSQHIELSGGSPPEEDSGHDPSAQIRSKVVAATRGATFESLLNSLAHRRLSADAEEALAERVNRADTEVVVRVLYGGLTGAVDESAARRLLFAPLSTATRSAAFSEGVLTPFVSIATPDLAVALFAALPRQSRVVEQLCNPKEGIGPNFAGVLERARAELRRSEPEGRRALLPAFRALLDRAVGSSTAAELSGQVLVRACETLDGSSADQARIEKITALLAGLFRRSGPGGWTSVDADSDAVSRVAARLPLATSAARANLLVALRQAGIPDLAGTRWWAGVSFHDLAATGSGAISPVLEAPEVADLVVRPAILGALVSAGTRRRVLSILASPASLVAALTPAEVDISVKRVSKNDSTLMAWAREWRDEAGRRELASERDALESQLRRSEKLRDDAEGELDASRQRTARLEAQLASSTKSATEFRGSQERQLKIDAMRAFAELAVFVEDASSRVDSAQLATRVGAKARRHGLRAIAASGDQVPFDPDQHEVVGAPVDPRVTVVVRRPGYTWIMPTEEVVLVRALVEVVEQ